MGKSDWRELFGRLRSESGGASAKEARNEIRRYVCLLVAVADLERFGLVAEDDGDALVDHVLEEIESPMTLASLHETLSPHGSVLRIIRECAYGLAGRLGRQIPRGANPRARSELEVLLESLSDEEVQIYLLFMRDGHNVHDVAAALGLPYSRVMQQLLRVNRLIHELFSQPH